MSSRPSANPPAPAGGGDITVSVYSPDGGHTRRVQVHFPQHWQDAGGKVPLIIALHGKNQTPEEFAASSQLSDPTVNSEFLVAYPSGITGHWTGDPEAPLKAQRDDVEFVGDLIQHLLAHYPVDPGRVYLAGFSNGAGLAALVACSREHSHRITALACASSAIYLDDALKEPVFNSFEATKFPIPLLEFHGDADAVIDYNGVDTPDGPSWPIGDWLRLYTWMQERGLHGYVTSDEAEEEELFSGKVERYVWKCGTDREIVVHYLIHGFGHGWPTTREQPDESERHGPTVIDATPIMLNFFRAATGLETTRSDNSET